MDSNLYEALCPDCQKLASAAGEKPEDKMDRPPKDFNEADERGLRRFGKPKTDEERAETHKAKFGDEELPPRGAGKKGEK